MGMLIDGRWEETPVFQGSKGEEAGRFVRRPATLRGSVGPHAEAGRYVLYVSLACPWAHRTLLVRHLKGLERAIRVVVVDFHMGADGWRFVGRDEDTGATHLRDLYVLTDPRFTGKVTVPVLWDAHEKRIVNNESLDIIKLLDQRFDAPDGAPELYPEAWRPEIDAMIAANYDAVNDGVYRAGFARTQEAYEDAVRALFARLDVLEALLSTRRWLVGPTPTLADVCLFTTLLRFDPVYHGHFKCNVRRVADYPALHGFLRDVYQRPGVADLCDFEHIKGHYYWSHESINPSRVIPLGPTIALGSAHGRDRLG